jgi:hypothetical protein
VRPAVRCGPGDATLLAAIHARSIEAPALRPPGGGLGGPSGDGGPRVVRVDPEDGAMAVFGDAPVVITVSHPVEPSSLGPRTIRLSSREGAVDGGLALSPDARVVIWTPRHRLRAGEHVVEVSGVRDRRGRDVAPHRSVFTVAHPSLDDLLEENAS